MNNSGKMKCPQYQIVDKVYDRLHLVLPINMISRHNKKEIRKIKRYIDSMLIHVYFIYYTILCFKDHKLVVELISGSSSKMLYYFLVSRLIYS